MMKPYNPLKHSVVQACFMDVSMQRFEASDFHIALLLAIAREIGRVHWNRYQEPWDRWGDDPKIPGIHWRQFTYDECDCPKDEGERGKDRHPGGDIAEAGCIHETPHFQFEDVAFDWYKNPTRGVSVSKDMAPYQWVEWFDRCLAKIREFDVLGGSDNPKKGWNKSK